MLEYSNFFYKELLTHILSQEKIEITFPNLNLSATDLVEKRSFQALKDIKIIIDNETLDDEECFCRIEEIIRIFERFGCSCNGRHDF